MKKLSFATTLKDVLIDYLIKNNQEVKEIYEKNLNDLKTTTQKEQLAKENTLNYIKDTKTDLKVINDFNARQCLIYLGTDVLRNIQNDIHVYFKIEEIKEQINKNPDKSLKPILGLIGPAGSGKTVFFKTYKDKIEQNYEYTIDDIRFPNEADFVYIYNKYCQNPKKLNEQLDHYMKNFQYDSEKSIEDFRKIFGDNKDELFKMYEEKILKIKEVVKDKKMHQGEQEYIIDTLSTQQMRDMHLFLFKKPLKLNLQEVQDKSVEDFLQDVIKTNDDWFDEVTKEFSQDQKDKYGTKEEQRQLVLSVIDFYNNTIQLNDKTNVYSAKKPGEVFWEIIDPIDNQKRYIYKYEDGSVEKLDNIDLPKNEIKNPKNSVILSQVMNFYGATRSNFTHPSETLPTRLQRKEKSIRPIINEPMVGLNEEVFKQEEENKNKKGKRKE